MNILSLFWGIECGRVALNKLGVPIGNYFSSELDPYPIQVTKHNHPDIVHIGSVTDVWYGNGYLGTQDCLHAKIQIDLLIGGSPCQDLSIAKAGGKWLKGDKSSLFFEYVRLLHETKPKYFMLENVASMKKVDRDEITAALGVEPTFINSSLVSGQNRKRLYWCGVRQGDGTYKTVHIPQPDDRGILLKDILEDIPMDDPRWKPLPEKYLTDKVKLQLRNKALCVTSTYDRACPRDYLEKSSRQLVIVTIPRGFNKWAINESKSPCVGASSWQDNNLVVGRLRGWSNLRIHSEQDKVCTLSAKMGTGGNNVPVLISNPMHYYRKLTVNECCRLQGLPDNYCWVLSNSRAYKAIGNGWQVDTVEWVFKNLLNQ